MDADQAADIGEETPGQIAEQLAQFVEEIEEHLDIAPCGEPGPA